MAILTIHFSSMFNAIKKHAPFSRLLNNGFAILLLATTGQLASGQVKPIELHFTVEESGGVDPKVNSDDIRDILSGAARYLNVEITRLAGKSDLPRMSFTLTGQLSPLTPLDDNFIDAIHANGTAIHRSEQDGVFIPEAVDSWLRARNEEAKELELILVRKMMKCPGRNNVADAEGCTVLKGKAGIIAMKEKLPQSRAYWVNEMSLLTAHEIAHLFGLDDLSDDAVLGLPALDVSVAWLMYPRLVSEQRHALLGEQCVAVTQYPDNDVPLTRLRGYITDATNQGVRRKALAALPRVKAMTNCMTL